MEPDSTVDPAVITKTTFNSFQQMGATILDLPKECRVRILAALAILADVKEEVIEVLGG